MIQMNVHQISAIVGGSMVGKEARIQGVEIDSRADCHGRLFVALPGERVDGHEYCRQAVEQGAAAVLVARPVEVGVPQIICQNTLQALQALAAAWIRQTSAKVIGITGSNGKTTVKNMLLSVLSQKHRCTATMGNLNNEIGVPLSLLSVAKDDQFAVIEMGAAQLGDIRLLASLAQPHMAVVTNVSQAHIGRFGSEDNIAEGKGELFEGLSSEGVAVINADSPYAGQWLASTPAKTVTFGQAETADYRLLETDTGFVIRCGDQQRSAIDLPVPGRHNYLNACAVYAMTSELGVSAADIVSGLKAFQAAPGRLNTTRINQQLTVIDDSYNANPASFKAAIDVLQEQASPTVLVVGDMAELGDSAADWHQQVGAYARCHQIDQVLAVGEFAPAVCAGYQQACQSFQAVGELLEHLKTHVIDQGTVLVKGSRSMRLEQVVEFLVAGGQQ
jgi:UDP-N-acetylmuramoyl-tripeptide--D-alanyl-D-alanine ligase